MKTNMKKIAIVALVDIIAVGSYFVSGTYAKYTSAIAGTDNANVAKWSWIVDGNEIDTYAETQNSYTYNLFNTIKDSNGTANETDVATDLIAPGTSGSFELNIQNKSEVNATYAITFTEAQTNAPDGLRIPIQYKIDDGEWTDTISGLNITAKETGDGNTVLAMETGAVTKTIQWRWVYELSDAQNTNDTKIGFAANVENKVPNVAVTATVTLTQVD
jgi:hypothetical protein